MRIGIYIPAGADRTLEQTLGRFERAEGRGFHTAWTGQIFGADALTVLALAGRVTRRIELGSWVVPTWPRHPSALAQQALTVQAASGNRLALGVGASHERVVAGKLGLDYTRPIRHMKEYLAVLRPLLAGEAVEHRGELYRVSLAVGVAGAAPPPVLLAALGPGMLRLAAHAADGVALWLGGPRFLGEFALPRLRGCARERGRPLPRVVCGLPVALTSDARRARDSADSFLAGSARLPAYRRVLEREGAEGPGGVAIAGDEGEIERRLAALAALGVDDFNAVLFPVEGDPGALERSAEFLGGLARERSA